MIKDYVVGYCFSPLQLAVALIKKNKPEWQQGKLNGVGGKVEPLESPQHAMAREFYEEAGVLIPISRWLHIRTEEFAPDQEATRGLTDYARVFHFGVIARSDEWLNIHTTTDEQIVIMPYPLAGLSHYDQDRLIYNLPYLIPMAAILLQQPPENRPLP